MASFLKGLDEYWRDTDDTYQKLVESKPRPKAVVFKYEPKKAIDKPTEKNTSGTPEFTEERSYILASDMQLPFEWAKAITRLQAMEKPKNITHSSWQDIQEGCNQLYRNDFGLLKLIINHEWQLEDVFGCHPAAPMTRFDMMGLLLLLHQGDKVVGVNKQRIKILRKTGSINVFRKSLAPANGRVLLYELVYN